MPKEFLNEGYEFEQVIYNHLKKLNLFDEIVYEKELASKFGWDAAGIDYLLTHNDKMILVQVKWRKSRRRENLGIHNFMKAIDHVVDLTKDKKYAFGLYISRRKPFNDNIEQLSCKKVHCLSDFNSMDGLASLTTKFLEQMCR